tara:strand:+ start:8723 stop:9337 length:615 start_codon:yes stop_codon:yes gene_type:complete
MKKLILTSAFILFTILSINAQSTERFIRVVGNSQKEIKANKIKIVFKISETVENTYSKTEKKTYQESYSDFIKKLSVLGFKESELALKPRFGSRNPRTESKSYIIETNINSLEKLLSIKQTGLYIQEIKYLFPLDNNLETELSLLAIEDAKRKANTICNRVKMKLGKVLNIEVKLNDFSQSKNESKDSTIIKTYRVYITFKLID